MAQPQEPTHQTQNPSQTHLGATFRWPMARRGVTLRRRRVLPSVRLGGKKPRKGLVILRVLRRMRLKWLKMRYICMMKKLKEYYKKLVKDLIEAGASYESFQQRLLMESSFAVPVMGVSLSSYPSMAGSDYPRSLIF